MLVEIKPPTPARYGRELFTTFDVATTSATRNSFYETWSVWCNLAQAIGQFVHYEDRTRHRRVRVLRVT
ncbi:hypothetical protein EVAR_43522_1 [Eumeta japonica]|uniref:Uncharacterized protein n=1 Tax=Eumeta variegata TaxID=151549 RepID=A0A4C1W9W6_EUMVA|nr:hypothetical protein EVAR_43522_1 [Eumeta japonica]